MASLAKFLTIPLQFLKISQQTSSALRQAQAAARAEDRALTTRINTQTKTINQQGNLINRLQSDFRITAKEVPAFVAATNKALAARQERQRLQTERNIARLSTPFQAMLLELRTLRQAENQRRAILRNAARGIPGISR